MTLDDLCFIDTETKTRVPGGNVVTDGTYRYMENAHVVMLTYAIGDAPVSLVEATGPRSFYEEGLLEKHMPADLLHFRDRVVDGKAKFVAFNAGFDRRAVSKIGPSLLLGPRTFLDGMAQAVASNLPPDLMSASRAVGGEGKQDDGKALIKLFCSYHEEGVGGTPWNNPEEWQRFGSYGLRDTSELRRVFQSTRALTDDEWREYWASEAVNDRGMMVDLRLAQAAAAVADADRARTNAILSRVTDGKITSVYQHQRIGDWLWDHLPTNEAREILIKSYNEDADSEENDEVIVKLSAERERVTRLLAYYEERRRQGVVPILPIDEAIITVLSLREYGASSTPKKFSKVLGQHVDGGLYGSYVFNGANQTGRYSSKGVQVHNLTRSTLGAREAEAIEMLYSLLET